jgi:hypothetical protein
MGSELIGGQWCFISITGKLKIYKNYRLVHLIEISDTRNENYQTLEKNIKSSTLSIKFDCHSYITIGS